MVSPQTEPEDSSHPSTLLTFLLTMNHGSISHEFAIFLFLKKCPSITFWGNENFLSCFVKQLIALFSDEFPDYRTGTSSSLMSFWPRTDGGTISFLLYWLLLIICSALYLHIFFFHQPQPPRWAHDPAWDNY